MKASFLAEQAYKPEPEVERAARVWARCPPISVLQADALLAADEAQLLLNLSQFLTSGTPSVKDFVFMDPRDYVVFVGRFNLQMPTIPPFPPFPPGVNIHLPFYAGTFCKT